MRRRATVVAGLVGAAVTAGAQPAPAPPSSGPGAAERSLDSLAGAWREGRYAEVIVPLLLLQADLADSSRFRAEYMIATSLCRSARADERRQGVVYFDAVQRRLAGRWLDATRDVVRGERDACARSAPVAAPVEPRWQLASAGRIGQSTYNGGKFGFAECEGEWMVTAERLRASERTPRALPPPGLAGASRAGVVIASVRRRLAAAGLTGYRVDTAGGTVLAAPAARWGAVRRDVVGPLAAHRRYLASGLGLAPVDSLFTLFYVPDAGFRRFAARLHGLDVTTDYIGYSMPEDLSMVVRPVGRWWGTAMHEQTHLVARLRLPDVPGWFDEGLAALFEVAAVDGDAVRGLPNWRGGLLADDRRRGQDALWLLLQSAAHEDDRRTSPYSQAVLHARARYLLLFAQRRGRLADVVAAMRARRTAVLDTASGLLRLDGDAPEADAARVARALDIPTDRLESEYEAFLREVVPPLDRRRGRCRLGDG